MSELSATNKTARPTAQRRIVLADVAGYCFGVRRAVDIALETRAQRTGNVTTLGPIIHNQQVIDRMELGRIGVAAALEQVPDGTVILSAHGVSPAVLVESRRRGLDVVDVTCPFVTKVHRAACRLHEDGFQVVMLGDPGHSEVKGVVGAVEAVGGSVTVLARPEDAPAVPLKKKVGVISQTTQRARDFGALVGEICRRVPDVRAINTICGATDELQEAAIRLAAEVDVALVIGGTKSANTKRLRELCEESGIPAYQIETAEEIDEIWLDGKSTIGITAGASTPDWIIEEVARHLNAGELPADWKVRHPDE